MCLLLGTRWKESGNRHARNVFGVPAASPGSCNHHASAKYREPGRAAMKPGARGRSATTIRAARGAARRQARAN
jgi:hypothetical protein